MGQEMIIAASELRSGELMSSGSDEEEKQGCVKSKKLQQLGAAAAEASNRIKNMRNENKKVQIGISKEEKEENLKKKKGDEKFLKCSNKQLRF